ncbi:ABC transporter ATP-binding protein [Paenibacillus sp. CGMCC 1.16610]|uniref:ATP-binding cassette domain-containing protein n=2 Tax=Paenibacillus anseongense TaxID=2682845 RepID=A0ABW9UJ00_9BACL|nr:ABC transporter ATP-binding protein [Paenibacillus sp. CGMCC 1.16610]MBA2941938.1 ABC transporter ATP-binding protein [Paenibacillus sp. CGMCC 1.16610]MVQ38425.1 ATP-binding cassette domain-containing protein [Paenibacillus anseongense]
MSEERLAVLEVHIDQAGYDEVPDTIKNIHFEVRQGELVGLLGPNGAGKSTTMKSILGLLKDFKGKISFMGERKSYAYIPEHPILYDELTLWEHMEFAASVYELDRTVFLERADDLLHRFRLLDEKHQLPGKFSKGMQQKIMLILGFLNKPDVYIVDEPFIGLDPKAIKDFIGMLDEERKRGAGILMSTHVLDTAERICTSFVLLSGGRLVANGSLKDIQEQCGMPDAPLFDCFHSLL